VDELGLGRAMEAHSLEVTDASRRDGRKE